MATYLLSFTSEVARHTALLWICVSVCGVDVIDGKEEDEDADESFTSMMSLLDEVACPVCCGVVLH